MGKEVLGKKHIKPHSKVAADRWTATESACKDLKLPLKQCNHAGLADKDGTHSNNAESEVARFKNVEQK